MLSVACSPINTLFGALISMANCGRVTIDRAEAPAPK